MVQRSTCLSGSATLLTRTGPTTPRVQRSFPIPSRSVSTATESAPSSVSCRKSSAARPSCGTRRQLKIQDSSSTRPQHRLMVLLIQDHGEDQVVHQPSLHDLMKPTVAYQHRHVVGTDRRRRRVGLTRRREGGGASASGASRTLIRSSDGEGCVPCCRCSRNDAARSSSDGSWLDRLPSRQAFSWRSTSSLSRTGRLRNIEPGGGPGRSSGGWLSWSMFSASHAVSCPALLVRVQQSWFVSSNPGSCPAILVLIDRLTQV
jgi:hypothetical protein